MKKGALLNGELSGLIATLGHGDLLVIGDAGLPVPAGVRLIDLAVTRGVPRFLEVLDAVLSEMEVERALMATEAPPPLVREMGQRGMHIEAVSHAEFKHVSAGARAVVRTGEHTPYANIALFSGVVF